MNGYIKNNTTIKDGLLLELNSAYGKKIASIKEKEQLLGGQVY